MPEPLSEAQLAELERLAGEATPGPWKVAHSALATYPTIHASAARDPLHAPMPRKRSPFSPAGVMVAGTRASTIIDYDERHANASFIAAANPAEVLTLVAEVRRLRDERDFYFGAYQSGVEANVQGAEMIRSAEAQVSQLRRRLKWLDPDGEYAAARRLMEPEPA